MLISVVFIELAMSKAVFFVRERETPYLYFNLANETGRDRHGQTFPFLRLLLIILALSPSLARQSEILQF
jgi:hypothetical protein